MSEGNLPAAAPSVNESTTDPQTAWQRVWREGIAPQLSQADLSALRLALERDDPALIQGATVEPVPLPRYDDHPVESACLVAYIGWRSRNLQTVREVEEWFTQVCFQADKSLGEPAACRWLLNWFDDTPRPAMRLAMVAEIDAELARRRLPWPNKAQAPGAAA
jgi:hypothetical protein